MNKLTTGLLYFGIAAVLLVGKQAYVHATEVQQPLSAPQVFTLNDGTRFIRWYGQLECDFKHGELVRELKYLYGYIGSLQAELKKRKYLNS